MSDLWLLLPFLAVQTGIIMPVLANIKCLPVEKSVQGYYLRDARKILDGHKSLIKIGITGSYGKTSTKFMLSRILSEKYNVLHTPESYNTLMGVTKTIREELKPVHEIFVCEMGANQVGDIKELCDLVNPKYGILTAIGNQHLDTMGSQENIVSTKYDLVRAVPSDGIAFLNFDNDIIREKKAEKPDKKFISYSIDGDTDFFASDIEYTKNGISFSFCVKGGEKSAFTINLLGLHNVLNATAAAAVAFTLGVPLSDIGNAIRDLKPVPHRLELIVNPGGYTAIDDAFNSNPDGANEALNVLSRFSGKKILVTPGFVDLAEDEDSEHFKLGQKAAEVCDFVILVGTKRSKAAERGLLDRSYPALQYKIVKNFEEAKVLLETVADTNSVVLFENDLPDNYEE